MKNDIPIKDLLNIAENKLEEARSTEKKTESAYVLAKEKVTYLEKYFQNILETKDVSKSTRQRILQGQRVAATVCEVAKSKIDATKIQSKHIRCLIDSIEKLGKEFELLNKNLEGAETNKPLYLAINELQKSVEASCLEIANPQGSFRKSLETVTNIELLASDICCDYGMEGNMTRMLRDLQKCLPEEDEYQTCLDEEVKTAKTDLNNKFTAFNKASCEKSLALAKVEALTAQNEAYKEVKC